MAPNASKIDRDIRFARITKEILEMNEKYHTGQFTDYPHDMELWNCVNRYVRRKPVEGGYDSTTKRITIFLVHANGFPKEASTVPE
jgi:hypothetical protein